MYTAQGNLRQQDLIESSLPMVRKEAQYMRLRLPSHIELDDLIQTGTIGLLDAVKRFDPSLGIPFEAFARQRVRGTMIDEIRRNDWVPRRVRQTAKQITYAIRDLNQRLGRQPEEAEVAEYMDVDLVSYRKMLQTSNCNLLVSFEDLGVAKVDDDANGHFTSPLDALLESCEEQSVAAAISSLSEREQQMLSLYYEQQMNLKEIGAVFGVSESRVCQIHSQAISRVRAALLRDN
jgi:RNA polymerase sigma factor for flagellar operon FliA